MVWVRLACHSGLDLPALRLVSSCQWEVSCSGDHLPSAWDIGPVWSLVGKTALLEPLSALYAWEQGSGLSLLA